MKRCRQTDKKPAIKTTRQTERQKVTRKKDNKTKRQKSENI